MKTPRHLNCILVLALSVCSANVFSADRDPAHTGKLERLRAALEDMGRQNEDMPLGGPKTGWGVAPLVVMGTDTTDRSIPQNWKGNRFQEWRAVLPWFAIFEGTSGGDNSNAAVEIGGIELWQLSRKSSQWNLLASSDSPTWVGSYAQNAVDLSAERAHIAGARPRSVVAPGINSIVHGGLGQVELPWDEEARRTDIGALFVAVKHRLVKRNASLPGDIATANLLVQAGADYYPRVGATLRDLGAKYVPGAGLGQMKRATEDWRYSTLIVKDKQISRSQILSIQPPDFKY